jgi:hypothetical protein
MISRRTFVGLLIAVPFLGKATLPSKSKAAKVEEFLLAIDSNPITDVAGVGIIGGLPQRLPGSEMGGNRG